MITITLNGEVTQVPGNLTVDQLLRMREVDPDSVAIAVDMEFVARKQYSVTMVENNQSIEMLTAVQGG
ncbi:MAG: sulfur carrier protein ThiS [Pseudomonadales bacterium]|nr:sulfur carrier protein ThiS [Pseudomonadales bacterium]